MTVDGLSRARFVTRLMRARVRGRPHTLNHLATSRCNGRCPTCLWRDQSGAEMDTASVVWLYGEAGRLGLAQLVVWGGEPLLRDDLPALLAAAKRAGLVVTLISNGWLLEERWPELRGCVDTLILSLDDIGTAHDRLRGLPGLYDRLEAFVPRLRHDPQRPILLVNTVLSQENRGALERVAPVARRWGAGLYFCAMETGGMETSGFVDRLGPLALTPEELSAAARRARGLKADGYPLLATDAFLDLLERDPQLTGYRCRGPHSLLTVAPDGAIRDCRRRDVPLVAVDELRVSGRGLAGALALPRRRELLAEADGCTACNNPDIIEMSWLWELRPAMLKKAVELAAR
ncbi:MAG: radical SAM protein [Thermoleophilia bacterium]|nr:radical SAM protein [Thermoleophilia bacterium]